MDRYPKSTHYSPLFPQKKWTVQGYFFPEVHFSCANYENPCEKEKKVDHKEVFLPICPLPLCRIKQADIA